MKYALTLLIAASLAVSCSYAPAPNAAAEAHAPYNVPADGLALEGYCPVAYFAVDRPVMGDPQWTSTHEGIRYQFASAAAQKMFDDNPEKFLPAYGGWCAYGMAVENKFPIDPTNYKIVGGRLMLFLKSDEADALTLWNEKQNEQGLVRDADSYWHKVRS